MLLDYNYKTQWKKSDLDHLIRRLGVRFLAFLRCLVVGGGGGGGREGEGVGELKRAGVSGEWRGRDRLRGMGPAKPVYAKYHTHSGTHCALEVSRAQFTSCTNTGINLSLGRDDNKTPHHNRFY